MRLCLLFWFLLAGPALGQPLLYTVEPPTGAASSSFGQTVGSTEDLDGDGLPDLWIGGTGTLYAVSSATGELLRSLDPPPDAGGFGAAFADLGAVAPGRLLVGAPQTPSVQGLNRAGRAYLVSGESGEVAATLPSPEETLNGRFGQAVAVFGESGAPLLAVGAPGETPDFDATEAGRVHLFSPTSGAFVATLDAPAITAAGGFGARLLTLDDVDGDGVRDLAVSEPRGGVGLALAGLVHVVSGADQSYLRTLTAPIIQDGAVFGAALALTEDLDGDGVRDLAIGAPSETRAGVARAGSVYVVSPVSGALLREVTSPHHEESNAFGTALVDAGDLDGDGTSDLAVTAPVESTGDEQAGRVYAFSGRTGELLATLDAPSFGLDDAFFGRAVGAAGNALVVSAYTWAPGVNVGRVYAFGGFPASEAPPPPAARGLRAEPNPVRGRSRLRFALSASSRIRVTVHDVLGREVAGLADGPRAAGEHTVEVDASVWAPGVYMVRLTTEAGVRTTRLTVVR